jgi:hypothetical protein
MKGLAEVSKHLAGGSVIGKELRRPSGMRYGVGEALEANVHPGQLEVGASHSRVGLDGGAVRPRGLLQPSSALLQVPQVPRRSTTF